MRLAAEVGRARGRSCTSWSTTPAPPGATPLAEFPESAWDKVLDLNLKAPFFLTRAFLPLLEEAATARRPGAGHQHRQHRRPARAAACSTYSYSSSKAALHHLTRVLAKELGPRRITVNAVAPGPVRVEDDGRDAGRVRRRDRRAARRWAGSAGPTTWPASSSSWPAGPAPT